MSYKLKKLNLQPLQYFSINQGSFTTRHIKPGFLSNRSSPNASMVKFGSKKESQNFKSNFKSQTIWIENLLSEKLVQLQQAPVIQYLNTSFARIKLALEGLEILTEDQFFLSRFLKPMINEIKKSLFISKDKVDPKQLEKLIKLDHEVVIQDSQDIPYILISDIQAGIIWQSNKKISLYETQIQELQRQNSNKLSHEKKKLQMLEEKYNSYQQMDKNLEAQIFQVTEQNEKLIFEINQLKIENVILKEHVQSLRQDLQSIDIQSQQQRHNPRDHFFRSKNLQGQVSDLQIKNCKIQQTSNLYQALAFNKLVLLKKAKDNEDQLQNTIKKLENDKIQLGIRAAVAFEDLTPRPKLSE